MNVWTHIEVVTLKHNAYNLYMYVHSCHFNKDISIYNEIDSGISLNVCICLLTAQLSDLIDGR